MQRLQLVCPVCGEARKIPQSPKNGFSDVAFDCAEWWSFQGELPPLSEHIWERLDILPTVGEMRIIKVSAPFDCGIGETFRMLFQPALSHFNGWDEHPEELERSAIVECRFDKILESDLHQAWISVKVISVTMLRDICKMYPSRKVPEWNHLFHVEKEDYFQWRNWELFSWSAQGDVGEWWLIYTDESHIRHLVLLFEWMLCSETLSVGNIIL